MSENRTEQGGTSPRRFKPYPAYKDSGVEWLGEIPKHWEVKRLKRVALVNPSKSEIRKAPPALQVSFVPMESVGEFGRLDLASTKELVEVATGYTYFREGDLLVAKITPCFENGKGALAHGLENGIGFGTTELHVIRPAQAMDARFLAYVTFADAFRKHGQAEMKGAAGQQRVPDDFVSDFQIPHPRLPEQRAIAEFLDRETGKIDALVAKKERVIELLQEKRTALIAQAVTKGLDRNVPMKDSGVEWLGEVPARWDVKRLKYLVPDVTVGIVVTPAKYYVDNGIPCLRSLNISSGEIDMDDLVFISEEANEYHRKSQIFEGDVVVVRTGQAGTAAIVPAKLSGANCIDLLIVRRSDQIRSKMVYYYLNSRAAISQAEVRSVGAIQGHYNTSTLANLFVPVIPVDEQDSIVRHLDDQTAAIDALTKTIRDGIDRLAKFRTALISAAVTGKIDVREEAA